MRPPTNAFEGEIYDAYWAMNRAHKGLHDALTSISMGAKWKDCQKAALLAEDKVNDAVIIGKIPMNRLATELRGVPQNIHLPADRKEAMVRIASKANIMIRSVKKAAAAPNPEKMKKGLMETLRITKEIEEEILRFYAKLHTKVHTKVHTKKKSYGMSRKRTLRHRQ
jgi:hypothetical protein